MLTEKQIIELQTELNEIYRNIELDLIINIASKFDVNDPIGGTKEWQVKKLSEMKALNKENIKVIAKYSDNTEEEVIKLFTNAGLLSVESDEVEYLKGVEAGKLKAKPPIIKNKAIQRAISKGIKQGNKSLNLVNTKALESANKDFRMIVNQAFLEVDAGISDYKTATRKAVTELADKGIVGQTYKTEAGKIINYNIDAAVRREVLTASLQTARDCQDARAKEYGIDLIEVSSHVGARPKCAIDQGKIYSNSGKSKKYPARSTTSEGQADGLFGINCKHQYYPYIDGVSTQRFKTYPEEENEKIYKQSQKQRYLENEIKKEKRRLIVYDQTGDIEAFEKASVKLKQKEKNLNNFMKSTGRRQQKRTQVTGFNKSLSQKAVQSNKKLQNTGQV